MNIIEKQIEKCINELFSLTNMLGYDKIRVEYNKNKKINDKGKLEVMPILTQFCS
jgi:hypothetical protein